MVLITYVYAREEKRKLLVPRKAQCQTLIFMVMSQYSLLGSQNIRLKFGSVRQPVANGPAECGNQQLEHHRLNSIHLRFYVSSIFPNNL